MTRTVELNEIPLRDSHGIHTKKLTGTYTHEELSERLIDEWVPYVECHQCPRVNTCQYPEPHPYREHQKKEIICGVKATILKNFIERTFSQLCSSDDSLKKDLLSAAYYLCEYAFTAEQHIGMLLSTEWMDWFGEYAPRVFGQTIHQRELLNGLAQSLRHLPEIYRHKSILLVEGESEKRFLEQLRNTHYYGLVDLRVEVYGGEGNLHPRRIQMRLEKYIEDGYICHIQGDKDGKNSDIFKKLKNQGVISDENTFEFAFDFETSVPKDLLLNALNNLGYLEGVSPQEFEQGFEKNTSATKNILENWGLDITPIKVDLADEIGWLVFEDEMEYLDFKGDFINETELGQFINFVWDMDYRNAQSDKNDT